MQISADISEWLTAAEKLIVQHKEHKEQVQWPKIILTVQKNKSFNWEKKKSIFWHAEHYCGSQVNRYNSLDQGSSLVKLSECILIHYSKVFVNVFNIAKSYLCLL